MAITRACVAVLLLNDPNRRQNPFRDKPREDFMRTTILTLASVMAFIAPCAAQPHDVSAAVESAAARPGEALICQYYYYQGTLIRRPICKTEHEWIRARLQQQAEVADFQLRALRTVSH
jgi:hypothetical protein